MESAMKVQRKKFVFGALIWSLLVEAAAGASFYGDGFVQLKAPESSDRNTIRLRFRTSSPSGVLFLAAGGSAHFLLELSAGRLQLKVDLGLEDLEDPGEQGESEGLVLQSERGIPLNDLAWHSVEVHHELHNVTLTLDRNFHSNGQLSGSRHTLHQSDGLFVGGSGGLDRPFLPRDLLNFRGCMEDVVFNQHDLLSSLRPFTGFKTVHEVSLGCSPQFFVTEDDPVSFFSSRAYVALPGWKTQQETTFECVVHTSAKDGIILYSSAREGDFVSVEIQESFPVAVVGKGGTKTELRSLMTVDDRKWHSIRLLFSSQSLELAVDGEEVKTSISSRSKGLQLKGFLFVGGIDDSTRSEVRKVGLVSVSGKRVRGGSFKGCLKNIKVNGVKTGLTNALVTKDISVGCEPEPSPTESPTRSPGPGLDSVTPTPSLHMSTLARGLDRKFGSDFVQLRNLVVQEGGRASLEAKHIKVLLDFKKLGIRQSQIMFRIREQPIRGQIRLDVDPDQEENTFSMLDLWHGRVMYVHGGAEEPDDFFIFSIYSSSRKQVPEYLKSNKLYSYNITVTPTNDAPELSLPEGNLFVLLENSKKRLTTDVLKATDIDSSSTDLVFSVLGNLNADAGYLEVESSPGQAVTSFSYVDLEDLKVSYVHTGVRNSRIVLRVSDGEKVSNTVVLRVMAVALEYKIANNTGLHIVQGGTAILGCKQLAVQTNAVRQVVDVRYDVIEAPQYGELQRLHSSGEWRHTDSFSQRLLEKDRLRYVSTFLEIQTSNASDFFKSKVTVASRATTEILFPISVTWVKYQLVRNVMIDMDKVRKATLDSEHLYASAEGVALPEEELHFLVLTTPKKGKLLLDSTLLIKNSTFSQRDVTERRVHYELVDRPFEDTNDRFKFQLLSKHAQSQYYDFRFSIRADINSVFMKNEGLSVPEGESKIITGAQLFAETLSTKEMFYTVTRSPKHGKLVRISQSNSNASYDNILTFSNQDILEERIMYVHDDSENARDEFSFIASISQGFKSSFTEDEVGVKSGVFHVSIQLLNDQKPLRVIDKVFHVVRDGQKLLTTEDLLYHDADSDFEDGQLIYTRRGIPVGDLVMANDTTHRLFKFRQKDLEEKRVLFIHKGPSTGRFVLFVSDGKHLVSSLLDVSAQEPYLKVGNNSGLLVQKGRSVTISSRNFSLESNLDIRDDQEVVFRLDVPPKHGEIYRNQTKTEWFSQSELKDGLILYRHDDSKHLTDFFNLSVKAKGLEVTVKVNVKVYLESHQRPPIILHHNVLLVDEGQPVTISDTKLEVTHEDNLPSEIVFTVKVAPSHGFLRRLVRGAERYEGTEQTAVRTFSQQEVNAGNIQYVQAESGRESDAFVLDATNGVTDVTDIRMSVDIIPRLIPLHVSNFTLNEGAAKALTPDLLQVINRHFSGINFLYRVTAAPEHGHVENSRLPGVAIDSFTRRQVEHEFIYYVHDGSETSWDRLTLSVNASVLGKCSAAKTLFIEVSAVNDETPIITANAGLRVWVSSVTEIRPEDLQVQDLDSPPEELHYLVMPPSNGHLALKTRPRTQVLNFTQQHIDQGQLLFVHKGPTSGGFNFQVNDGENFSPRQIFSITATALVLNLETNRPLRVFPGSAATITDQDLRVTTNDVSNTSSRIITFNVIQQPRLGRLVRRQDESTRDESARAGSARAESAGAGSAGAESARAESARAESARAESARAGSARAESARAESARAESARAESARAESARAESARVHEESMKEVSTFTQDMVNRGEVVYVQTILDSMDWSAIDSFTFSVTSAPASLDDQTYKIHISYDNTGPEHNTVLRANTGAEVTEGQSVVIDESKLDASNLMSKMAAPQRSGLEVWFQVSSLPRHGVIVVGERNLTKEKPNFSQYIVSKYGITYIHDDSETTSDSFLFSAWLNPKGKTAQRPQDHLHVVEERFNITVRPVNDQAPVLKTKAPSLRVVQGDTVALGPSDLRVDDLDNPPEDIQFSVISKPNNGHLALQGSLNQSIAAFTQAQINNGSIFFIQDGSSVSGVFYFSVTDGHHKPIYKLFNLEVTEISISLVNSTGLTLEQGKTSVPLTNWNLAAQTNGKNVSVLYRITRNPQFGKVLKEDQQVTGFSQEDLQTGRMSYHMVSLNSSDDSFEFMAFTSEANVTNQLVNVTVTPLVRIGNGVRIPNRIPVKLKPGFLNASELANVSASDPVFEVISHPSYGKVVRTESKTSGSPGVETFTYQDLVQGLVALELNANMTGVQEVNDSLAFVLKAPSVRPARGEFHFTVVPYDAALLPTARIPVRTSSPSPQTTNLQTSTSSSSGSESTALLTTQQPNKNHQRFKARSRWGNRTGVSGTTLRPTHRTEEFPFRNPPVRVESVQKTSSPLLVVLPLLALLLLVVIFVVLVVFLRHHRRRKSSAAPREQASASTNAGPPGSPNYQGQPQRSPTVPTVTVTPLSPSCPGSPVLDRLLIQNQSPIYNTIDSDLLVGSWSNVSPAASSQMIRTATPTLQTNQYWV